MKNSETTARVQEIRKHLKARRKGGCQYAPCSKYVPKHPDDYGYGSCTRCGWSEPEHIIDQLRDLMDASQARAAALAQERDKATAEVGRMVDARMALGNDLERQLAELRATLAQVTAERDEARAVLEAFADKLTAEAITDAQILELAEKWGEHDMSCSSYRHSKSGELDVELSQGAILGFARAVLAING
jgi:hypothetical protein